MKTRYSILFGFYLLVLYLIISAMPKEVNWSSSFSRLHTIPYGCFVLYEELGTLFPNGKISEVTKPAYQSGDPADLEASGWIFINRSIELDPLDKEAIFKVVQQGHTVFLSGHAFSNDLLDTFGISMGSEIVAMNAEENSRVGRSFFTHNLSLEIAPEKKWHEQSDFQVHYFADLDTNLVEVLGHVNGKRPNFIRIPFGSGYFLLHSSPFMFTNFNLLKSDNHVYISNCMRYLRGNIILWDEYYKEGRPRYASSPLSTLLRDRSFRVAIYLGVAGILLFLFFHARRRQRIIPEIDQYPNMSVEFAKTLGDLYYAQGDNLDIARKRISCLKDFLHEHYQMHNITFSEDEVPHVARRSGHAHAFVASFFALLREVQQKNQLSAELLTRLNDTLQIFYHRKNEYGTKRTIQGA